MRENEKLEELLEENNRLLAEILDALHTKRGTHVPRTILSQDDKDAVDEIINLEDWFSVYGEQPHPAKYMNFSGIPFNKQESDYIYSRLKDFTEEPNEAGTHVWKYLGKTYCKAERNTVNCFAFIPAKGE